MKCTPNYRITLIWYLCVYEPVGSQGKCPQRLLFWAVNWLKMTEQMVQTWSGHNETAIGETNCEGCVCEVTSIQGSSEDWRLPRLGSECTTVRKLLSCFLGSNCISCCLLPPNVFLQKIFLLGVSNVTPNVCLPSPAFFTTSVLAVGFGKHQILNTCCQKPLLPANSNQYCSNWHRHRKDIYNCEINNSDITRAGESLVVHKLTSLIQYFLKFKKYVSGSDCASHEKKVKTSGSCRSWLWRSEVWRC